MWEQYRSKQSTTNTFEYKREKYGWTEADFDAYNASRSVTLENLIARHGIEKGTTMFEEYREKQRTAGVTLAYFIDTYGVDEGTERYNELSKKKSIGGINSIKKKIENGAHRDFIKSSKLADEFIKSVVDSCVFCSKVYASIIDGEYGIQYTSPNGKSNYFFYDLVIPEINTIVEFDGEYWHNTQEGIARDVLKTTAATSRGFDIIRVKDSDYLHDKLTVIESVVNIIKQRQQEQ